MGWGKGTIVAMPSGGNTMLSGTVKMKEAAVMALSDGKFSIEEINSFEKILEQKKNERRANELEDANACSGVREFIDSTGTVWSYVVVRDEYVRIVGCTTEVESLQIPDSIEDLKVIELAVDACSRSKTLRSIVCGAFIEHIDKCAFRENRLLERLVLPPNVDEFDLSWVRNCDKLSDLVLPGMLATITPAVMDAGALRKLTLGFAAREFMGNPFSKGMLEELAIDPSNPYIETDGNAVFSKDGAIMFAMAIDCEEYAVPEACEVIGKKAFANCARLARVTFPSSIIVIEDYAFSYSGIKKFVAPPSLRSIGERAFFRCRQLTEVTLNEGLVSIGDNAFTNTDISALHLPSTLEHLGMDFADKTGLVFTGKDSHFSISSDGILYMDAMGGLYRNTPSGKHFVRMLDDSTEVYAIEAGTREVEPLAFFKNKSIREVEFPEGMLRIGKGAFREAEQLSIADLPSTLLEIGEEAFLDTSLSRVFIPRDLEKLGSLALITRGAHNSKVDPSLMSVDVHPENKRFYSVPGLLIERHGEMRSHVVVYADSVADVVVPDDVTVIDQYAFGGAKNIRSMRVSNRVRKIDMRGLSIDCLIEHLYIDLETPIEGHQFFDLYYPVTDRSAHEQQLGFNLSSSIYPPAILEHYDSSIINMHSFDKGSEQDEDIDLYLQARLALDRLADPVLMTITNRTLLLQCLNGKLEDMCEAIARHDDRQAIDDMLELGILNRDNLLDIIDSIGKLQDAAMTGYLLEIKRRLFGKGAIDFDL